MYKRQLLELGHRKIVYIGETNKENRYKSYCEALAANGIKAERSMIVNVKQGLEGGYQGACELLKRQTDFTAVFCANDATAIGAIKGLQEGGYKIPSDISVISIDAVSYTHLGYAMAEAFAQEGAKIIIADIQEELAGQSAQKIAEEFKVEIGRAHV